MSPVNKKPVILSKRILARFVPESERFRNKAFQPEDIVFYFNG